MRLSQTEKFENIRLVEQSNTSVNKTLKELGINKPTFYLWYNAYLQDGYDGLAPKPVTKKQYWNQIPESEKQRITELALDHPQKVPREIACLYIKDYKKYVSESSVYRILKAQGLIQIPAFDLIKASDEFKDKTVRINEMWQTDFTYFKIPAWGWYYSPMELENALKHFVDYYNHERFHETLKNVTPADMYFGRATRILEHRKKIKQKTMMERRRKYYAATCASKIYSDAFLGHQKPRKMHVGNKFYDALN